MAKQTEFEYPEELFVLRVCSDTPADEYLQAVVNLDELIPETLVGQTVPIGVYQLKKSVRVTNKIVIEE